MENYWDVCRASTTGQVSQLLVRWGEGDREALDELMFIVYDELRRLGSRYLAARRGEAVLQPTVLIHEAWIRLAAKQQIHLRKSTAVLSVPESSAISLRITFAANRPKSVVGTRSRSRSKTPRPLSRR